VRVKPSMSWLYSDSPRDRKRRAPKRPIATDGSEEKTVRKKIRPWNEWSRLHTVAAPEIQPLRAVCAATLPLRQMARAKCRAVRESSCKDEQTFPQGIFPAAPQFGAVPRPGDPFFSKHARAEVFAADRLKNQWRPPSVPSLLSRVRSMPPAVRTRRVTTTDGLTLRMTTDIGSRQIVPLEDGAARVRYTVPHRTDARGPAARNFLDTYFSRPRQISRDVEIPARLPPQAARSAECSVWVQV